MPLVSRTRATLRSAEFGFFGVVVYTRVHTPRRWGLPLSAGVLVFSTLSSRPLRTSCWIVGISCLSLRPGASLPLPLFTSLASCPSPPSPGVGCVALNRTPAILPGWLARQPAPPQEVRWPPSPPATISL